MKRLSRTISLAAFCLGLLAAGNLAAQPAASLTGEWDLDVMKSDDAEEQIREGLGETAGRGSRAIQRQRLMERLIPLARAADHMELELSDKDLKVFDREDRVSIYYLDGKKHERQGPRGDKMEAVANWDGNRILVQTEGQEIGKIQEIYGLEGHQLAYIVRIQNEAFQHEVVIRHYYNRVESEDR